jgi:hypothetical protein
MMVRRFYELDQFFSSPFYMNQAGPSLSTYPIEKTQPLTLASESLKRTNCHDICVIAPFSPGIPPLLMRTTCQSSNERGDEQ